jgi:aryl-alcohol dehydrogenase-like predicted oxidoreductase
MRGDVPVTASQPPVERAVWKGRELSRLSLGTVQLGCEYGIANRSGRPDERQARRILEAALRGGINHFDTAAAYGASEAILGRVLGSSEEGRQARITTKLPAAPPSLDATGVRAWVRENLEASLRNLRRTYLDAVLLHEAADFITYQDDLLSELDSFRGEGKIGCFGASVYRPEEGERVLAARPMEALQIPFNLLDQRWRSGHFLPKASARGVALFARSVFLQGLFWLSAEEVGRKLPWGREARERLEAAATRIGLSAPELGLRYVLSFPEILSVVVGCEREEQVGDLLRMAARPPLDPGVRKDLEETFRDVPERVVNPSLWFSEGVP